MTDDVAKEVELSRVSIGGGRTLSCSHRTYRHLHSLVVVEETADGRRFAVRIPVGALQAVREASLAVADAAGRHGRRHAATWLARPAPWHDGRGHGAPAAEAQPRCAAPAAGEGAT